MHIECCLHYSNSKLTFSSLYQGIGILLALFAFSAVLARVTKYKKYFILRLPIGGK